MSFLTDLNKHREHLRAKIHEWEREPVFHECNCEYCNYINDEYNDYSPEEIDGTRNHYGELILEAKKTLKLLDRYENDHSDNEVAAI